MSAFQTDVFEDLHSQVVTRLLCSSGTLDPTTEDELFAQLSRFREPLSQPCVFRSREDTVDLTALARHVQTAHAQLATEQTVQMIDQVSRELRLHQHDCCNLVERAIGFSQNSFDIPQQCAAMFYRECHFEVLCLHDLAQGLSYDPPDPCSVAFFASLGGQKLTGSLCNSLCLLLRDLATDRKESGYLLTHASGLIQLLVETIFAWTFKFKSTSHQIEEVLALLPHVVVSQHAPLGQGFTLSDLDLILREENNDISIKLCLALICMMTPDVGGGHLDITKVPDGATPSSLREKLHDLKADGGNFSSSPLGAKMQNANVGDYWNIDSPLGRLLCFTVNGLVFQDDVALRRGYLDWHIPQFLLHEVLSSGSLISESGASRMVLRSIHDLFTMALLPVGRGWVTIRKLDTQADALQIVVLQCLNRLCRTLPMACSTFREMVMHCTDTFHLHSPGAMAAAGYEELELQQQQQPPQSLQWFPAHGLSQNGLAARARKRHDNSPLYAEILSLLSTICARGSLHCARLVCQKLVSHSNQWFNWGFLMDSLSQISRAPSQGLMLGQGPNPSAPGTTQAPVVIALCHLVSAACSCRLWLTLPPPPPSIQVLPTNIGDGISLAEGFGALLTDLMSMHSDLRVKAACLGALAHIDFSPAAAKAAFASVSALLPALLVGISDPRSCCDGLLAIELLSCAIRLVQAVPLGQGRYSLDLQPLTHVVVHHILMKVLSDMTHFSTQSRFWRLAALTLRWLRLVLRGPLPLGSSVALNSALLQLYADSEQTAVQVANRNAVWDATAYVFRCLLCLDSPVFGRLLQLLLLRGHGLDGLLDRQRNNAARPFKEQTVHIGLDVLRLLFQRDTLFCRLFHQHAADRAGGPSGGAAENDAGGLLLVHRLLFAEFGFTYPPLLEERTVVKPATNPFACRRMWDRTGTTLGSAAGWGGGTSNPSYFSLLLDYAGAQAHAGITRLALFVFLQCSLRDPAMVSRLLQLEPWRLHGLCADLHTGISKAEDDGRIGELGQYNSKWDADREADFAFESGELDCPVDAGYHLDVTSFLTGLAVCNSLDIRQQLEDDASVQAADLLSWACSSSSCISNIASTGGSSTAGAGAAFSGSGGLSTASAESWQFDMGYLRGFGSPTEWLSSGDATTESPALPLPVLVAASSRSMLLRGLALLLAAAGPQTMSASAPRLGQILMGLDPDGCLPDGCVDVDSRRSMQVSVLEAVLALLEYPPTIELPAAGEADLEKPNGKELQDSAVSNSVDPDVIEEHSCYEVVLGIMASLFETPSLRDVALRHIVYAWPSRFEVLETRMQLQWTALPLVLRQVLLSQLALVMQIITWEMRLCRPILLQTALTGSDKITGNQRTEMMLAAAENLQEVVKELCSPSSSSATPSSPSWQPVVVSEALRLLDGLDSLVPRRLNERSSMQPELQQLLSASACFFLAPGGGDRSFGLSLELADPFLFQRLCGEGPKASRSWGALFPVADASKTSFEVACQQLPAANASAAGALLVKVVSRSYSLFMSAVFYHFGQSTRRGRQAVSEACRMHVEALLPHLEKAAAVVTGAAGRHVEDSNKGIVTSRRLQITTDLLAILIQTLQRTGSGLSNAGWTKLFDVLRKVTLHPASSLQTRTAVQEALLAVLQQMAPTTSPSGERIVKADGAPLRDFVRSLLRECCMNRHIVSAWQLNVEVVLGLLAALFLRLSPEQLDEVCGQLELWQHFRALLECGASQQQGEGETALPRLQTAQVLALITARPSLASLCFESGALSCLLHADFLLRPNSLLTSSGINTLDVSNPAALLVVLEVLVTIAKTLPAHKLALLSVVDWLDRNQRLLSEVMTLVVRQPLQPAADPASNTHLSEFAPGPAASGTLPGLDLRAVSGQRLLLCIGQADDPTTAAAAAYLNGFTDDEAAASASVNSPWFHQQGPSASSSSSSSATKRVAAGECSQGAKLTAVYYRCSSLFAELWALLHARVADYHDDLAAHVQKLETPLSTIINPLLAQMSTISAPVDAAGKKDPSFDAMDTSGSGPGKEFYPSEATRLSICLHLLQSWRYDSLGQAVASAASSPIPLHRVQESPMNQWVSTPSWSSSSPPAQSGVGLPLMMTTMMSQQFLVQVHSRLCILCLVFAQCCSEISNLRLCSNAAAEGSSSTPSLLFEGTREQFTMLFTIIEVCLQQLLMHFLVLKANSTGGSGSGSGSAGGTGLKHGLNSPGGSGLLNLSLGLAAATSGSTGLGILPRQIIPPKLPIVVQSFRWLQQMAFSSAGSLLPLQLDKDRRPKTTPESNSDSPLQALDLSFVTVVSRKVEELAHELQSL